MTSRMKTAEDFKKDKKTSEPDNNPDLIESDTSGDDETSSDDDIDKAFNNEDKLICRLYRKVVDHIMSENRLRESQVDCAIGQMKEDIHQGHKRQFRKFGGIDFNKPENRCSYLRRYAICHTGLVKQLMWNFFLNKSKNIDCEASRSEITTQNHLKVISLGGGPGNDLIGFCCALQEVPNAVKKLDLYIVDINNGWRRVFPTILKKAVQTDDVGSFGQCLKEIEIKTGFMEADLTDDGMFENEDLSITLCSADIILMVKLTSFLPDKEAENLIYNVVDSMKTGAKLVFIDQPYDENFFWKMKELAFIYHGYTKYELSFNPVKSRSPSIESTQGHIGIYEKICLSDDSSASEES